MADWERQIDDVVEITLQDMFGEIAIDCDRYGVTTDDIDTEMMTFGADIFGQWQAWRTENWRHYE